MFSFAKKFDTCTGQPLPILYDLFFFSFDNKAGNYTLKKTQLSWQTENDFMTNWMQTRLSKSNDLGNLGAGSH